MEAVKNQRGSVIVFVTLMIVLLLIMVGLGLDTGQLTYVRNQGQAAVDAAALAAVSALPSRDDAQIKARAAAFNPTKSKLTNDYVESGTNKIGGTNVSYVNYDFSTNTITYNQPLATANGVRVALEGGSSITTPVFLTPLLNLMGLSASATQNISVSAVSVLHARPSVPIALWSQVCDGISPGANVKIRQQEPGSENSCWTCFLDNSCGSRDVKDLFVAGKDCSLIPATSGVDVGVPIYENKGQQASNYDVAYDFFFKDYPGRKWVIPVIKGHGNCNEKNPSPIEYWAEIEVTKVHKAGAKSYIAANVWCKASLQGSLASLCFANRLVREPNKGY